VRIICQQSARNHRVGLDWSPFSGRVVPRLEVMDFARSMVSVATAPARVGLAAAEASLNLASVAVGVAKRSLGDGGAGGTNPMTSMLGIDDAIIRANRLARLMDDDAPLGRAMAPDGPVDRLLRPGGVVDLLMSENGLVDRLTAEGGGLKRAL
jgi:hypothetical protein